MKPIELQLVRKVFLPERTVSALAYEGKDFGWVVEDTDRGLVQGQTYAEMQPLRVQGKTCIAYGHWPIVLRDSPKFGPDTLTILVLGHQLIRIHVGNTEEDTEGCICPGLTLSTKNGSARTGKSAEAVAWLKRQLVPHLKAGGEAWIRITRD